MIPGITAGQRTVLPTDFLFPSLFTDTDTFYSPTVTPGAVTLTPALFSDTDTFYAPVVSGPQTLLPSLFTDTDTFHSPTVIPKDQHIASVKLLLGCEGADASTTVTDESPSARGSATVRGNAQIDTAQFKFGASSLLCDGTSDAMQWADSADWHFGSGNFTVEAWVRFNNTTNQQFIVCQWQGTGAFAWVLSKTATHTLQWAVSTTGSNAVLGAESAWGPSTGTWYHVAVDFDGTNTRIYVDGVMLASSGTLNTIFNAATVLSVGGSSAATPATSLNGWIDEVRVTKGVARYASDSGYTVPDRAFPRS